MTGEGQLQAVIDGLQLVPATRSPRKTGPSKQARTSRVTPSSPTTGTAQPWQSPVAQVIGRSSASLAPGADLLGGRRDRVERRGRSGGVDDLGLRRASTSGSTSATVAALADRAVGGDHGDRAGRATRLQGGEQVRLVGAGDDQGDRALALSQPLGEREQRRRGVPLTDQHAADRLLGQRERPTERAGDLEPGTRPAARPASGCPDRPARRPARGWRRSRRWV